jgi:putative alpha-1,2-mannosidase
MRELGPAVPGYYDFFAAQLRNVVAAIHGTETLCVPGTEARKSVALIEQCYSNRKLLEMPWLDETEIQRAQELANA